MDFVFSYSFFHLYYTDIGLSEKEMIQCKNLTKKYGEFTAVSELNLNINRGEIFALMGPNGAGKTTTMNILVGLIEPTSGTATIGGYDVVKNPIQVKKISGYLPENVSLYGDLTARQNVKYIADLNGGVKEEKIDNVLKQVKLLEVKDKKNFPSGNFCISERQSLSDICQSDLKVALPHAQSESSKLSDSGKKAGEFSKGMMQRLGLACVLIKDPKVLFLDEPTSGLDLNGKIEIQRLLKNLRNQGMTIFFCSHILGEVKEISDRIGIINNSRLERIIDNESIEDLETIYKEITGIM